MHSRRLAPLIRPGTLLSTRKEYVSPIPLLQPITLHGSSYSAVQQHQMHRTGNWNKRDLVLCSYQKRHGSITFFTGDKKERILLSFTEDHGECLFKALQIMDLKDHREAFPDNYIIYGGSLCTTFPPLKTQQHGYNYCVTLNLKVQNKTSGKDEILYKKFTLNVPDTRLISKTEYINNMKPLPTLDDPKSTFVMTRIINELYNDYCEQMYPLIEEKIEADNKAQNALHQEFLNKENNNFVKDYHLWKKIAQDSGSCIVRKNRDLMTLIVAYNRNTAEMSQIIMTLTTNSEISSVKRQLLEKRLIQCQKNQSDNLREQVAVSRQMKIHTQTHRQMEWHLNNLSIQNKAVVDYMNNLNDEMLKNNTYYWTYVGVSDFTAAMAWYGYSLPITYVAFEKGCLDYRTITKTKDGEIIATPVKLDNPVDPFK